MAKHQILDVFDRIMARAPFVRPRCLELFCGPGASQAKEYAPLCEYFEGWEILEDKAAEFKKNFPQATVKVCDVFKEVNEYRGEKFNVILVDNSFLKAPQFEHFGIFPGVYRLMAPVCFVVLTVCPDPFGYAEPRKADLVKAFGTKVDEFMLDWDKARDAFYGLPAMDSKNLPKTPPVSAVKLESLEGLYREKFEAAKFNVPYTFSIMRSRAAAYVMVEAHQAVIEVAPIVETEDNQVKASKPKRAKGKGFGPLGGVLGGGR
jgi:hypothetical protein